MGKGKGAGGGGGDGWRLGIDEGPPSETNRSNFFLLFTKIESNSDTIKSIKFGSDFFMYARML